MYYILPKDIFLGWTRLIASAHYIDLPDGTILAKIGFPHAGARAVFESHNRVKSLPHPMSSETIGPDIANSLTSIGAQETHKTYDVAALAAKIHPLMKL